MKQEFMSFKQCIKSPLWEGVIFPGLERDDPRTLVYEAEPSDSLKPFIQAIWFMSWDLSESGELYGIGAPIPCVKLLANNFPGLPGPVHTLLGVKNKGVVLTFRGKGQAVGIDFKPGGQFPFIGKLNLDAGGSLRADELFSDLPDLPIAEWDLSFAQQWLDEIAVYFESRLGDLHPNHLEEISKLIEVIQTDRNVTQVDDLLTRSKLSKRSMQRIFQTEVGLSIKETIRIARFNHTIRELNGSSIESFANFALESGYFDQPHMVNDFRRLVAESPKIFRKYW